MKLNIKILLITALIFNFGVKLYAQEDRTILQGKVKYNDTFLEGINIVNLATKIGTASNSHGIFIIPAAKGDSILFSSISYQNRTIVITDHIIEEKSLTVYLEPGFNELDEVEILRKVRLEFNNVAIDRRTILDEDEITRSAAPDVSRTFDYNTQLTNGVSFIGIYNAITKNAKAKKRAENNENIRVTRLKDGFAFKIRNDYGDKFFVEWLYIPVDEINVFLDFCEANGLRELYDSNEFLVKNFLVLQSNEYLELKK
ncbi:carboxypeptidase-like regulatory domain-containing protein [Lutibacter holmesii]|uniref:Carboxypeptidase-like regulatory domain-containing protein n=1 Tax=Lutibacter holmesii TaxID=1137985 RepID=A0ABW3WK48_9FLAO